MAKRLLSIVCAIVIFMMAWGMLSLTDVFGEKAEAAAKLNGTVFCAPLDNFDPNAYGSGQGFGPRSVSGGSSWHAAIDYGRDYGTSIYPIYEGKVVKKGYDTGGTDYYGAGHYITIQHDLGNRTIYSHYQHMNAASTYNVGDFVTPDNVIGHVGHSGDENYSGSKMGCHLDIRIMEGGPYPWGLLYSSQVASTTGSYESATNTSGITYYNPAKVLDGTIKFNIAPIIVLDVSEATEGKLWIRGWAFDPDNTSQALAIHVYVRDNSNTLSWVGSTTANTLRQDVDDVYQCGNAHGFDAELYTKDLEGTYAVHVAALDTDGGPAKLAIKEGIFFTKDSTPPVITDVQIKNVSATQFDMTVQAFDNAVVASVKMPTWRSSLGGDAATWHEAELIGEDTWNYTVPRGTEESTYYTDVYVYDYQGNSTKKGFFRHSNIVVTFDANGGRCDTAMKDIAAVWLNDEPLQTYGVLPQAEREGYDFLGWFAKQEGGEEIVDNSNVMIKKDHTLYAHWKKGDLMQTPDFILPAALTVIEENAFSGLSMTVVMLPEGLEEIGAYAFKDCSELTEIYIPDSVISMDNDIFQNCSSELTIFGHTGKMGEAYANLYGIEFVALAD